MLRLLHRSPDATEPSGGIPVTPDGTAIVDLTAPATPAAPAAPAAPQTIEEAAREALARINGDQPAASGDPGESSAPLAGGTDGEPAPLGPLVAELPPRTPDGEPVKIAVQSQEELEAIARLRNGYMRREQIAAEREQIAAERAEIAEFTTRLQADPVGWIADNIPEQMQSLVAEALVAKLAGTHQERFDVLLADEAERKMTLAQLAEKRAEWRETAERASTEEQYRTALLTQIQSLVPESASDDDFRDFVGDTSRYVASLIRNGEQVRPEDLPSLLAGHVRRYGFAQATSAAPTATSSGSAPSAPVAAKPAATTPAAPKAVPLSPADLIRRAGAAAVVPAGAGAVPSTTSRPPSGMRIEDAANWWRQRAQAAS